MQCFLNWFLNQMQAEHPLAERSSFLIFYAASHWATRIFFTFPFSQQYHKIPASFQSFQASKNKPMQTFRMIANPC